MSVATEQQVSMLKSVELAIQRETRDDWAFADAVYDDIVAMEHRAAAPSDEKVNTGLYAVEDELYDKHREAGTEVTRAALHNMFVTRRVWPPEERRPDLASFAVHYELRSKEFHNRKELIEKHAAKSRNGRWGRNDLRRWKSERKPKPFKSFRELFEERVRRVAFQAGKPWRQLSHEDRIALADACDQIAREIREGTFGVE